MNSSLLYGPPASGKTTIAYKLADEMDLEYISVGQITREEITKETEIGRLFKKYLDQVQEYPVGLIAKAVEHHLLKAGVNKPFLLDGFPKYPREAKEFLNLQTRLNLDIGNIVVIEVPLSVILERASNRRICQVCLDQYCLETHNISNCPRCQLPLVFRDDDCPDILKRRYDDYERSIEKTLKILGEVCGKVIRVDGRRSQEEVLRTLKLELS